MERPLLDFPKSCEFVGGTEAFICTECGEGFQQYPKLLNHMAIHGPFDSFPFDGTSNGYDAPLEFALHKNGTLTVVDRLSPNPSTGKLANQFLDKYSSSTSRSIEHDKRMFPCERCGQVFCNQLSLQQHQRYHSLGQGFKCTLCCKVHCDRESLREHLQDHAHERFYSCGHCGKRFLKQETLATHQKERHGSFGPRNLSKLEDNQENSDKSYPCKICGLQFFWLSDLQSHLISHSLRKTVSTDTTQVTNTKKDSDSKDSSGSQNSPSRPYRCGLCGNRFQQLSDLKEHHLSHQTKEERDMNNKHPLDEKNKIIPTKPQMQRVDPCKPTRIRGRRVHHSNYTKLYPCKHCHRVFVHSSSLSRHMRYHKGTLHTCVYCGRNFPQRCDVTRHVAMYHKEELAGELADAKESSDIECDPKESSDLNSMQTVENGSEDPTTIGDIQENQSDDNPHSKENETFVHPKPRLSLKCHDCGKIFGLLSVYQRHLRYHKREPSLQLHKCLHCQCRFSQHSALELHLETHKNKISRQTVKETSATEIANNNHVMDAETEYKDHGDNVDTEDCVSPEVLYDCTECTETFSSLQMFLKHQSAHGADNSVKSSM
ncbi:zinc finger protein 91 [Denticeps clupeoides]|uniref:C2H2-type domain-containing protein n=1 Tax=Denticeps clupeoides TaxID=299321 RepID=A0AAY4AJR1_9TELE|nr:zinc finger protein 91-like [Denticeps clupeoides]XP_028835271.1 zinc finger protein 91-like [Denticeps clupeoides]